VLGESQILAQVKQAYETANAQQSTGPLTHSVFQAAVRIARRVANETTINQRRLSIPSIAVGDFARGIFEIFDDKRVLVVGAGEMAKETLQYLVEVGAKDIHVVNRHLERAEMLALRWQGEVAPWEELHAELAEADLVVSTTGATEPIVTAEAFRKHVEPRRHQRTLLILDLAAPRDFEPQIGQAKGVYLYSIDDLAKTCEVNRAARNAELSDAAVIVEEETRRFMADWHHRRTVPVISQLLEGWRSSKDQEVVRLLNKLPHLDERSQAEVARAFDRLINKLLHPPLESLRDESRDGPPHGLIDALRRLFKLGD